MSKFRVIELFGGIGATTKALKRIGIEVEVVDYVEIDKYAVASYNAINNTLFPVQDITGWDKDYKDIDLIGHGSPCQDYSIAGKHNRIDLRAFRILDDSPQNRLIQHLEAIMLIKLL